MKIVKRKLADLVPYENNPRINEAAVDYVANSLQHFGWQQPIVIDKNNVIIAGHTRYKAALKLGWVDAECKVASELTAAQVKEYRLADNKVGEMASWDYDMLGQELEEIFDIDDKVDMSDFGFAVDAITEDAGGDDEPKLEKSNFSYQEQYGVIVMCKDEAEQEQVYNRLTEEGFDCKVVAT